MKKVNEEEIENIKKNYVIEINNVKNEKSEDVFVFFILTIFFDKRMLLRII